MSWKSLTQTHLSDTLVNHHKALEELDSIDLLNDWKAIETLMAGPCQEARPDSMSTGAYIQALLQSWHGLSESGFERQRARP